MPPGSRISKLARYTALHLARAAGVFSLAQFLTRKRLRILCYHGFSVGDEYQVAPNMFMRGETFERRLRILRKRGVPVLNLDEAVRRLRAGEIRNAETVITLDDGWVSSLTVAAPLLTKFGFPACVYITSEHLDASPEVFNVALYYILYRSKQRTLRLERVHPELDGVYPIPSEPFPLQCRLGDTAERVFPRLADRRQLLATIARALDMDLETVLEGGRFQLLDKDQVRSLHAQGLDIQLHTHTHRLPQESFEAAADEIIRNRQALEAIVGPGRTHFCYPSGKYTANHPTWLRRLGIASATTCDPGLNGPGSDVLQLARYLDDDSVDDIAFEAEICGLRELVRSLRPRRSHRG